MLLPLFGSPVSKHPNLQSYFPATRPDDLALIYTHNRLISKHHRGVMHMSFIWWLIMGGILGWLASIVMNTNHKQGMFLNIVVGIVGAMLAGWIISPMLGISTINQDNFSLASLFVSFLGAVILLAIVNFFRHGKAR
jgi:uncharacterized membrane protein YeaQ/YmgE (transglycosylase-associated protein family)